VTVEGAEDRINDKNTPLINELLSQIGKHPEFETWRQKGKHPTTTYNLRTDKSR